MSGLRLRDHKLTRLVLDSITLGLGQVALKLLPFLLLPIFTRYLTPEDYGAIALGGVLKVLLQPICGLGLTNGVGRYFHYPDQARTSREAVVWSPILLSLGVSAGLLGPCLIFSPALAQQILGSPTRAYLVQLILLDIFASNLASFGVTILMLQQRMMLVNVVNIGRALIAAAAGVGLVIGLRRGMQGFFEANAISALFLVPVLAFYVLRQFTIAFNWDIVKAQLRFSVPLVLALYAFWVMDSSDRFLVQHYLSLQEVGLYHIGYNIGMVMLVLVDGFGGAWPSFYHQNNQQGQGQRLVGPVLTLFVLVGSIPVLLLSLAAPYLAQLLGAQYVTAYTVVPFVAMAYFLKGPYLILIMGVIMKNRSRWQLYLESGAAILNVLGNMLLLPIIGREAASITTLLAYAAMCVGAYHMMQYISPAEGANPKLVALVPLGVMALACACLLFPHMSGAVYLGTCALVVLGGGVFLGVFYKAGVAALRALQASSDSSDRVAV